MGPYNARVPAISANGQEPREESPTSQPENAPVDTQLAQPVESGAVVDPKPTPEPSTPHGEDEPQPGQPRDEQGRFSPKPSEPPKPDPVKDAIDRLARKSEAERAPKQPEGTPAKAEQKPKDAKAPEAKPTDEALKSRSESNDKTSDAKAVPTFSPEEMAALKQSTRTRIETLSSLAKEAREKLAEAEPLVQSGKEYRDLIEGFELQKDIGWVPQEHIAGLVKVQAAVNRSLIALNQNRLPADGDLSLFKDLASQIDTLRSKFGISLPASTASAPELKPFEGELPADLKDMVEIYGVDEKRVRLLAAMEGRKAAPPAQQPAAQPTAQPAPQQPAQPAKPRGVDMEVIYARKLAAELGQLGVQNPNEQLRVLLRHPATKQEVIRRFPGTTIADVPEVFDALEPQTRNEILLAAHKAMTAPKVPSRSPTQPPPATTQRGLPPGTAPARRSAPAADGDAVAAAIAHLARPE